MGILVVVVVVVVVGALALVPVPPRCCLGKERERAGDEEQERKSERTKHPANTKNRPPHIFIIIFQFTPMRIPAMAKEARHKSPSKSRETRTTAIGDVDWK